jgi:hypothetical protein
LFTSRSLTSLVAAGLGSLFLTGLSAAPAFAHADLERIAEAQQQYAGGITIPLIASSNVGLLATHPSQAGISGCFMKTAPLYVQSNVDSVRVFDISDPTLPIPTGVMPSAQFENEAMNCGERKTTSGIRRFAMVGVDPLQASPGDISHANVGDGNELVIVEVTDPANPHIASRLFSTTSTHTVTCVDGSNCTFAYSAGEETFSIFDLRRLDKPRELDSDRFLPGVQPFKTPTGGHKWNFTGKYGIHTGWNGSSIWDVSKPMRPRVLTTTGKAGKGLDPKFEGFNDFIHHNSAWPNARKFAAGAQPSVKNGNVLLVTEEDYNQTDCALAGSFQTWWIKSLKAKPRAIVPLDKVELADLGNFPLPQGAFCSSHWFDYHSSGIVAAGFYGGGTQFLDVRNPREIKSYGYATWGVSEVWDAYFVPEYGDNGVATGKKTDIVFSVDAVRGLDVYQVALPGTEASNPLPVSAAGGWGLGGLGAGMLGLLTLACAALTRRAARTRAVVAA